MANSITAFLLLGQLILLVGGAGAILLGKRPGTSRVVSSSSAALGSLSWLVAGGYGLTAPANGILFTIGFDWQWVWRLDRLSSFFLIVVAGAGFLASIYGYQYAKEYDEHGGPVLGWAYNWFILSLGLVLTADGVLSFLLAWEFMSISSLFLVGLDHHRPNVRKAAFIYGIITHGATALLMVAFVILANIAGTTFSTWHALQPGGYLYHLTFALFLIGFGSKAGLVPVHVWLPRAHPAAPSHVSALMSGVMVKVAIYGLLRVAFTWLAIPGPVWGGVLLFLGILSALVGALYAIIDPDLKGVLAYSTIENVGLLVAGIGAALLLGPGDAATLALGFVLLHVVSHATFKTLLFLGAGAVQGSTHTRKLDRLGGLIHLMPKTSGLILVGVLTISAIPPLAGFASEWTLMQTLFRLVTSDSSITVRLGGAIAMAAVALTAGFVAAAMVRLFGVVFLGRPRSTDGTHAHEAHVMMRFAMTVLAALCLAIGLSAKWLLGYTAKIGADLLSTQAASSTDLTGLTQATPPTLAITPATTALPNLGADVLAVALIGVVILVWLCTNLLTRHFGRKNTPMRRSIPWGCGLDLTPAMQYSGLGLAEPARVIFNPLLRLKSALLRAKGTPVGHYQLTIPVPGEGMLYKPVRDLMVRLAERVRRVQAGSLQLYLAYLFATLVVLLLFAR